MDSLDKRISNKDTEEMDETNYFLFYQEKWMDVEKNKVIELYKQLHQRKKEFEKEKEQQEQKIAYEFKRIESEKLLFEKKLKILKDAYAQLDLDRKTVELEKKAYHSNKKYKSDSKVIPYNSIQTFFKGVDNILALKKRYKDLIKIFHPDNLCGDKETVQIINQEYNALKEKFQC